MGPGLFFYSKHFFRDFLDGPEVKNLPGNAGDVGSIPGQGTKIPHAKEQLSLHASTRESCSMTKILCAATKTHAANTYIIFLRVFKI